MPGIHSIIPQTANLVTKLISYVSIATAASTKSVVYFSLYRFYLVFLQPRRFFFSLPSLYRKWETLESAQFPFQFGTRGVRSLNRSPKYRIMYSLNFVILIVSNWWMCLVRKWKGIGRAGCVGEGFNVESCTKLNQSWKMRRIEMGTKRNCMDVQIFDNSIVESDKSNMIFRYSNMNWWLNIMRL